MAYLFFREYYVLWNIAVGGRADRRDISAKIRLHVYVCKTNLMDEISVNELYSFLIKMMDSNVSIEEFHSVLLSYTYAIVCRERKDGSLRGVILLGLDRKEHKGIKYTLIKLGLSFFQNYYRGGPLMYYVIAYHVMKELVSHPFTPLYIVGKSFSYKSYVAMCKANSYAYPRYDRDTPEFEKELINEYGESVKAPNEVYNPDTFILERERTAMKEGVAVLSDSALRDPHIKFFNERNPGWTKGHQLIVLGRMRWLDVFRTIWKVVRKVKVARKEGVASNRPQRRKVLERRITFQSEIAESYRTVYSEVDMGGGSTDYTISPDGAAEIYDQESPELHSYDIYDDL